MSSLDEHQVYQIQKGRMVKEEEIVKDVVGVGLQSLTAGEKSPLNEYNAAFRRLQQWRRMRPVSLSATIKKPSEQVMATLGTQIPQPQPTATSPVPLVPATETDEEVLEEGLLSVEPTEIDKLLEDIENGVVDETLPRLTEDDVAFDMDEIVVEDDEFVDTEESDTDDSEDDIGWTDKGEQEG